MEMLPAHVLSWAEAKGGPSGGTDYPPNLYQARHAHCLHISAVYFDPVSTAVAYECVANNDTENVVSI